MNRKGLSPVVASIILIAVTVAVSIAVAAWMGALAFDFMGSEKIEFPDRHFIGESGSPSNNITLQISNTGSKTITISSVKVDGNPKDSNADALTLASGATTNIQILNVGWQTGRKTKITVRLTSGIEFDYEVTP